MATTFPHMLAFCVFMHDELRAIDQTAKYLRKLQVNMTVCKFNICVEYTYKMIAEVKLYF